jgi:hypothetical protein
MSKIRVIDDLLTVNLLDVASCHQKMWELLKDSLEEMDFNAAVKNRSISFKEELKISTKSINNFNWIARTRDGQAPFQIDAQFHCDKKCGTTHVANLVICLNNREAIGSNFLKLEIAALREIRLNKVEIDDSNVVGFLVTLSRELLDEGGWDPSYADSSEYANAAKTIYKPILRSNILGLRIHQV